MIINWIDISNKIKNEPAVISELEKQFDNMMNTLWLGDTIIIRLNENERIEVAPLVTRMSVEEALNNDYKATKDFNTRKELNVSRNEIQKIEEEIEDSALLDFMRNQPAFNVKLIKDNKTEKENIRGLFYFTKVFILDLLKEKGIKLKNVDMDIIPIELLKRSNL